MTWPEELGGAWLPLPLPIGPDDGVDLDLWGEALASLADAPLAGWCASASGGEAGEYAQLSAQEWQEVVGTLGAPAVLHAGHPEPAQVLARAQHGARLGPAALLVPAGVVEQESLPVFLSELQAGTGDVPLLLVESPTSPLLEPGLVDALRRAVPTLAGLCLSARGEGGYEPLRPFEEELALWVPDIELATGYRSGACGTISAHACLFPAGTAEWFAALEEDMDEALAFERRWQRFDGERLHPLRDRCGASRAALDKALAVAGGAWPGTTRMRWPGEAVPPERALELRDHADRASVLWS